MFQRGSYVSIVLYLISHKIVLLLNYYLNVWGGNYYKIRKCLPKLLNANLNGCKIIFYLCEV